MRRRGGSSAVRAVRALLVGMVVLATSGCQPWTWGDNAWGQLGTGSTSSTNPVPAAITSVDYADLSVNLNSSCAHRVDGTLWCWGANGQYELGVGYTDNRDEPVQAGAGGFERSARGFHHTCGLRLGGQLWCWGANASGQLGLGDTTTRTTPVRVGTATWLDVAASSTTTCAIRTDGTLWCWGDNAQGQVGNGTTVLVPLPVDSTPTPSQQWQRVEAGLQTTVAFPVNVDE